MTLTEEQIQEILNLRLEGKSIGYIVRKTKRARNTMKKYLQKYHLLDYTYSQRLYTGPPSIYQRPAFPPDPQHQKIIELSNDLLTINAENCVLKKRTI